MNGSLRNKGTAAQALNEWIPYIISIHGVASMAQILSKKISITSPSAISS
jgi:hypothetical protein